MSEKKPRSNNTVVPNDGSYLGTKKSQAIREQKIKEEFEKAWAHQKDVLKDSTVKLYKDKNSIGVQWQSYIDWDGEKLVKPRRIKRSLNALGNGKYPHTANAVSNAISMAKMMDLKIQANMFSWDAYPQWLPKKLRPKNNVKPTDKTIAEWIQEYEDYYWLSRDRNDYKNTRNWYSGYQVFLNKIKDWKAFPNKKLFDDACRAYPASTKRNECCSRIKSFAHFCGMTDYDPKEFRLKSSQIKVKAKAKRELTDTEVEIWFDKFPQWTHGGGNPSQWRLWQWMFGMQAAYGFRNHETLNIMNLDEGCTGEDGRYYYAFTDKEKNPRGIIYTEGKGVKRAAFLPNPVRWVEEFKLRDIPQDYYKFQAKLNKLDKYQRGKKKTGKLHTYINFLRNHGFTFTAYNLRHHYNVKTHHAGLPAAIIAKNLGHTLAQNTSVYLKSQGLKSCLDTIKKWEEKQESEQKEELTLEQQITELRQENEQLKALLQQLFESIKSEKEDE